MLRNFSLNHVVSNGTKVHTIFKELLCKWRGQITNSCNSYQLYNTYKSEETDVMVNHEPTANLFFADIPGRGRAFLEYERENELIRILHTEVPAELEGRGLGKILAKEALDFIAKNDLRAEIHCEFVRDFVTKYEPKFIKYIR